MRIWKRNSNGLDDDGNELILPKTEQIPSDYFEKRGHIEQWFLKWILEIIILL